MPNHSPLSPPTSSDTWLSKAPIVDFLLTELQLDPEVPVTAGWTAANIAAWAEHHEVLALLHASSAREVGIMAAAWQSMTNFMGFM